MSVVKQQKWKKVEYSRSKIIKSGKTIKNPNATPEQIEEATRVIDNWRAAHAFPLHVVYIHLRGMAKGKNIIVAERLKRLDSIIKKLEREPTMSLWMMQDLGGCRFIVPTIEEVYRYAEKYDTSRKRHIFKERYDYIANPKPSGYRSLHMVYEYHSDKVDTYNKNMLIEIQYRTHLQHIWATALETLNAIRIALNHDGSIPKDKKGYYLLVLNYNTHRLGIRTYLPSEFDEVNTMYTQIEKTRATSGIDAVLVRASSFKDLKSAYPNYFADIGEFYGLITGYLK